MRVYKDEISVTAITQELGMNGLQDNHSIRMRKIKGDGTLEIFTWDKAKRGHDWDPLDGYRKKRDFVKALEEHIDQKLGCPGAGRKLTKEVGAYNRTFFSKYLPKMNGTQTKELERKFNERLIQENKIPLPKVLEECQSMFGEKLWRRKVYIKKVLTAKLQDDLKSMFNERFKLNKASQGLDPKFLTDNPRMTTSLHNADLPVDLRDVKDEKQLETALNEFAGDAWQNLSSLLWQDPIGSLDRMFVRQTRLILQDASKQNAITAKVNIRYDIVYIEYENKRFVNHLLHAGNYSEDDQQNIPLEDDQQNIPLDERISHVSAKFGFSISLEDLGRGKVDSLEIVGKPFVYCTICPGIRPVE